MSEHDTGAINLLPDGSIESRGGYTSGIQTERVETGVYQITGVEGLAQDGWKTSIYTGIDGQPTLSLDVTDIQDGVEVVTTDPETGDQIDIIEKLTLRFDVPLPEQTEDNQ